MLKVKVSWTSLFLLEEYARAFRLSENEIEMDPDQDHDLEETDQPDDISIVVSNDNKQACNEFSKNTINKNQKLKKPK
jgi:hypothetical protein